MESIIAEGSWGQVEWAKDTRERMPAREYYLSLPNDRKAKIGGLFKLLAEKGRISNREKFKNLGAKAKEEGTDLWEFKSFQDRFIGDFRPGKRFLVAYAVQKKKGDLRPQDIEKAVRILKEHDQKESDLYGKGGSY